MTKCTRCRRPVTKSTPVLIRAVATDRDGLLVGPAMPYGPTCARKILGPSPRRLARPAPPTTGAVEAQPVQLPLFHNEGSEEE
jgi:hypothetical protein